MQLLDSFGLIQHVSGPTHVEGHTLDLVISRPLDDIINHVEVGSLFADHHALLCMLNLTKPSHEKSLITFRRLKSINMHDFKQDLKNQFMHCILNNADQPMDILLDRYNTISGHVLDQHAPECSRILSIRPRIPWFSEELCAAKRSKRQAERRWRRSHLTIHRQMYKFQRNNLNTLMDKAKSIYFNDKIIECHNDQKALYKVLNGLLHRESKLMLPVCECPLQLSEKFSHFFVSKIQKIRDQLPVPSRSCSEPDINHVTPGSLLSFTPIENLDVLKIIRRSATKSCSLDPIPTQLLKECIDEVCPVFTAIINKSFETASFPSSLKRALVSPLLKKPSLDKEILGNYRPVSNLNFLSKTIERVVAMKLKDHMSSLGLYEPMQSAYRAKHSTETAILRVHNDILMALDHGQIAILVMLDLSAAFDTIDHELLLLRLKNYLGVDGNALKWFKSYLSGRTQAVSVSSVTSHDVDLEFGVPQGSVLGPILFTVYTLPLGHIVRHHGLNVHFYADDTQIYSYCTAKPITSMSVSMKKMEHCINEISQWMANNKLKLNDSKTELLIVRNKHLQGVNLPSLCIGGSTIQATPLVRNLGCVFDQSLSMVSQVNSLTKSCYYHLRNIGTIRKLLTKEATETLVHALVTSRLDLGNAVLYGIPNNLIQKLQLVQNTAARIVSRTRKHQHISPVLRQLHWLPVQQRIIFKILLLTYKALNSLAPAYICDLLKPYRAARVLRSSDLSLLTVPRSRLKTYGDRAFCVVAPRLWNSLPLSIRSSIVSVNCFKARLKKHLFGQQLESQ